MRLGGILRSRRTPCYVRWQFGCATAAYSSRSIHVEQRKHPQGRDIIYYVRTFRRNVFYWRFIGVIRPSGQFTDEFCEATFCFPICGLLQRKMRPFAT